MHIKQVIIRGFKTYKDQVQLSEDFVQGVNVVVGFNGSGKSNFFNAILFVISDHYGTMRNETRKSLLHEGAGPAVLTAFVELVFDNVDRKLPIDRDEVRIRRTIAAKKDDYSLDGRVVTRNEIFKLLESCGFAKSNPYYIVQQGKVGELTLMTDSNRLELFKEISGASIYDERRAESERILEDLRVKREKTNGVIAVVRSRIAALEDEQKELFEYQKLEGQRRCLEYVIADKDWKATQERIDKLEVQKVDCTTTLHEMQRQHAVAQARAAETEAEVGQLSAARARVEAEKQECEKACGLRMEQYTRACLERDDENRRAQDIAKNIAELQSEKKKVEVQMQSINAELEQQRPESEAVQTEIRGLEQRKHLCQVERDSLLAKQGRGSHYTSVAQRNRFLNDEIKRRVPKRDQQAKLLEECQKKLSDLQNEQPKLKKKIEDIRHTIQTIENRLRTDLANDVDGLNRSLDQASEQLRISMEKRANLLRDKEQISSKIHYFQGRIESTMPRPVRHALAEVRRRENELGNTERVFGTLLDVIEVEPQYATAVESAAGNALFNLLVADDGVAAEIVQFVRQQQCGSIVCTPMNQIRPRIRQYPKINGTKPLVEIVKASDHVFPAVKQVFGRTMVCNDLDLCDVVSHKHDLDAVTLDGDRVSSQGTMTGGYQDPNRYVRLKLCADRRELELQLKQIEDQLPATEANVTAESDRVKNLHEQKRVTLAERQSKRSELAQASETLNENERQLRRLVEEAGWQREREHELSTTLAEYNAGIEALIREKESETLGQLSAEEHARIESLSAELADVMKRHASSEERYSKIQRDMRAREQHLNGYLRRRLQELGAELLKVSQLDHQEHAQERARVASRLEAQSNEVKERLQKLSSELRVGEDALAQKKQRLDEAQKDGQRLEATIKDQHARLDDIAMKTNSLVKKKAEYDEKLRMLTIVASVIDQYKAWEMTDIISELRNVNKSLRQYDHVNKKAVDQFSTFKDQLEELDRESGQITESEESIQKFIAEVDGQKEQVLARVMSQVSENFQDVFHELVAGGSAKLVPLTSVDEDIETMAARRVKKLKSAAEPTDNTKGVRIEISFTGQSTSMLTMSQLSGGQKTVVALALIFAIQRLEPAPFYLFDEIDAALDTQYRTAVARLIQKDSAHAQMICTTFRPEIIENGDRYYRVSLRNRVSAISSVTRSEARKVIEEQTAMEGREE